MKIVVRIKVDVADAWGRYPSTLEWTDEVSVTDNPSHYGHEVQQAVEATSKKAIAGIQPFVVYRPDGHPEKKA